MSVSTHVLDAVAGRPAEGTAVREPGAHHHVPLPLPPFAYSTHRGS